MDDKPQGYKVTYKGPKFGMRSDKPRSILVIAFSAQDAVKHIHNKDILKVEKIETTDYPFVLWSQEAIAYGEN